MYTEEPCVMVTLWVSVQNGRNDFIHDYFYTLYYCINQMRLSQGDPICKVALLLRWPSRESLTVCRNCNIPNTNHTCLTRVLMCATIKWCNFTLDQTCSLQDVLRYFWWYWCQKILTQIELPHPLFHWKSCFHLVPGRMWLSCLQMLCCSEIKSNVCFGSWSYRVHNITPGRHFHKHPSPVFIDQQGDIGCVLWFNIKHINPYFIADYNKPIVTDTPFWS